MLPRKPQTIPTKKNATSTLQHLVQSPLDQLLGVVPVCLVTVHRVSRPKVPIDINKPVRLPLDIHNVFDAVELYLRRAATT